MKKTRFQKPSRRWGAPPGNQNAAGSGLYAKRPTVQITVAKDAQMGELAQNAQALADAALWIAEGLDKAGIEDEQQKVLTLYASVGDELNHLAAELAGESGIKAAALGRLGDVAYETLMINKSRALSLILSQITTAWKRLKDREEIEGSGLVQGDGELNPVLEYLAAAMRSAKRMMRDWAAAIAWRQGGGDKDSDLAERLMEIIRKGQNDE